MLLGATVGGKGGESSLPAYGGGGLGHSVADLLDELATTHTVSTSMRDAALELDKAYIPSRYPNAHPSGSPRRRYTRAEAERLIMYAEQIVTFCEDLLSAP